MLNFLAERRGKNVGNKQNKNKKLFHKLFRLLMGVLWPGKQRQIKMESKLDK